MRYYYYKISNYSFYLIDYKKNEFISFRLIGNNTFTYINS